MTLRTEGGKWRAKPASRINARVVLVVVSVLLIAALAVGAAWWFTRDQDGPPAPPAPLVGAQPLSALESAGIVALLDKEKVGAHALSGTLSVNGRTLGVQLAYLADGTAGSGTLSAGGLRGDVLIDGGVVFLRGDQPFWQAVGVAGPPPATPGWVVLPPDFLGGKVFVTPQSWTAALLPTPSARLDGQKYSSGRGDAAATLGDKGIESFHVGGLDADVRTITPAEVTGPAAQLGAEHGPGVPLGRNPAGTWAFPGPAPGEPGAAPGGPEGTAGEQPAAPSTSAAPSTTGATPTP